VVSDPGTASLLGWLFPVAIQTLLVFGVVLVLTPLVSRSRSRLGVLSPDRAGEDRTSNGGREPLAPMLGAVPVLMAVAVIPYGGAYLVDDGFVSLVVADINWGFLYVLAGLTLAAYAPVLAGRASGGASALNVGLRAATQMISYSLVLGLCVAGIFMLYGSLKLTDIAAAQDASFAPLSFVETLEWGTLPPGLAWLRLPNWGIFLQPLGFLLTFICLLGANLRPPFDSPEADFGLYPLTELVQTVVIAALVTTLFLGSWTIPFVSQGAVIAGLTPQWGSAIATGLCMLLHVVCFLGKLFLSIWLQLRVQTLLPRLRYEQVMDLCWKGILPASLANLLATALAMIWLGEVT
jgi:NADH-quinone oxidoreductase subunit H